MEKIIEKCQMFISLAKVNMYVSDASNKHEALTIYNIPHFLNDSIKTAIEEAYQSDKNTEEKMSYFIKLPTHLCFLAFREFKTKTKIIIGPFTDKAMHVDEVKYIGYQMKLSSENVEILLNFINTIPLFNNHELLSVSTIFQSVLDHDLNPVKQTNIVNNLMPVETNDLGSKFEQYEFVKNNMKLEEEMLKVVESGEVRAIENFVARGFHMPPRNPFDPLREAKNLDLTLNSICMRAALKGGLSPHLAHSMSHKFAVLIEKQVNAKIASALSFDIILEYTKAVNKYSLKSYSILVKEAILHIRRHLTEPVSLGDIASVLNISKEHLSRQFKKETSMTVSHYIQKLKVEESLELLASKEYTLSNIAYLFGFSNPSHYSTTFKKIIGISPAHYQKENHKNNGNIKKSSY